MAGGRTRIDRAAASHRQAAAIVAAARRVMDGYAPRSRSAVEERSIRELAERLRVAAALLTPGWLGAPLSAVPASTPLGVTDRPELVRVGTAYPLDDASFPVVVPLGHLAVDGDARDARVAGVLRAVLLRLTATARPGAMLVRAVDPIGGVFAPFAPLHDAGIMPPPVADRAGLQAVLTEAEHWVRGAHARPEPTAALSPAPPPPGPPGSPPPAGPVAPDPGSREPAGAPAARPRTSRSLLLVIAGWPQTTEAEDFARLSALAAAPPDGAGLHIVVAGWPPPPLPDTMTPAPLPHTTHVRLRNPYALVGHPPGGSFGAPVPPGAPPPAGLNAYVYLDEAPPPELISRVCGDLAAQAVHRARVTLGELLPEGPIWTENAAAGLRTVIGHRAGNAPVTLQLGDLTPHWLVVGGPGSGKSALLLDILYGFCSRYGPDQLRAYLLDFTGKGTFADFVPRPNEPSHLPHARAVGTEPDRAGGLAALRELVGELTARDASGPALPRLVCVIDEPDPLLAGDDPLAVEAAGLLAELARRGGPLGVHLVLAGRGLPPAPIAAACRVRIALPGGAAALDPANDAAAGISLGMGVVNTASGLGGPRGATRAHEQLVRFPDPGADEMALAGLRHRLWSQPPDRAPAAGQQSGRPLPDPAGPA